MTITLPKNPAEAQYEDLVCACLLCLGYFIEPRIKLREGGVEVLEMDVVATPSDAEYLNRVLVDAKSGAWGFSDVFKVSGWVNFLHLTKGLIVHKNEPDQQKAEVLQRIRDEAKVDCKRLTLGDAGSAQVLPPCVTLDPKAMRALLATTWYALIAQRLAFGEFVHRYKSDPTNPNLEGALHYHRACEKSFFNRKAVERVHALCEAHHQFPNVTGRFIEAISAQTRMESNKVLYRLTDQNYELWLQYIMLLEHKARVAIIKNSLDHLLDPAAKDETVEFMGHTFRWVDLHLPPGCLQGLEKLKGHKHATKLPLLFQMFIEVFGGFYAPKLQDDLSLLAAITGVPEAEIPACLKLYDDFFPFKEGWFYDVRSELRVMKMIPAIARGAGALVRHAQFGLVNYRQRYGASGNVLQTWHNAIVIALHPELGTQPPPTPVAGGTTPTT